MLVLLDMEWIDNENGMFSPTQIAAIRVDNQWTVVDRYSSLIRPYDAYYYKWQHEAYNGATQGAFLTSNSAYRVFSEMEAWLREDDSVCFWERREIDKYRKMVKIILKKETKTGFFAISKRAKELVEDDCPVEGNAYDMAEVRNICTPVPQHCSKNDVETMRLLLSTFVRDPNDLFIPASKKGEVVLRQAPGTNEIANTFKLGVRPYWMDMKKNTVHAEGCPRLFAANEIRGYASLEEVVKRHAKACSCVVKEYRKAAEEHNVASLNRGQYNYSFASNSGVFHRHDCHIIRTMYTGSLMGAVYYDACIKSGRTPCRVCKPEPFLDEKVIPVKREYIPKKKPVLVESKPKKKKIKYLGTNRSLDMDEQKAFRRFRVSRNEREELEASATLSEEERRDIMTLTHPGYAYWAVRGYENFHLRHCSKMKGLKNLRGFALYQEAINAGFTPCKECKPTKKHQITVSIPLSNYTRYGETIGMLDAMCDEAGFKHEYADPFYTITTSVGKWRINANARPVQVRHVNFVVSGKQADYHRQPRIFLSLTDTFNYILRHDRSLEEKQK